MLAQMQYRANGGGSGEYSIPRDGYGNRETICVRLAHDGEMVAKMTAAPAIDRAVRAARKAYDLGGRGERLFGQDLCGDPGLNIILDLFLSTVAGKDVCVSSACIGSRVAMTTALRYLSLLRKAGYVDRVADPCDGRRHYIVLTSDGWHKTMAMLEQDAGSSNKA